MSYSRYLIVLDTKNWQHAFINSFLTLIQDLWADRHTEPYLSLTDQERFNEKMLQPLFQFCLGFMSFCLNQQNRPFQLNVVERRNRNENILFELIYERQIEEETSYIIEEFQDHIYELFVEDVINPMIEMNQTRYSMRIDSSEVDEVIDQAMELIFFDFANLLWSYSDKLFLVLTDSIKNLPDLHPNIDPIIDNVEIMRFNPYHYQLAVSIDLSLEKPPFIGNSQQLSFPF